MAAGDATTDHAGSPPSRHRTIGEEPLTEAENITNRLE